MPLVCVCQRINRKHYICDVPPLQCISPGIVETEFAFRHHNSDPEKAAAVYESMKVSLHMRLRANWCISQSETGWCSFVLFAVFESWRHSQCSHVCVKCSSSCPGVYLSVPRRDLFYKTCRRWIIAPFFLPSDRRRADEASRAGVIAVK